MTKVSGLNTVLRNLDRQIEQIEGKTQSGLIKAAIAIRRNMDESAPKIPVDTNNLRASWYVVSPGGVEDSEPDTFSGRNAGKLTSDHASRISEGIARIKTKRDPAVILGFSASYAWFVHEMVGATFSRPGAGAKFLEKALKQTEIEIVRVIQGEAKIR